MHLDAVVAAINDAFGTNEYPGDRWIVGSSEGCEPEDEVGPFRSYPDWRTPDAGFLDGHYAALSFFSEAGFRFYLPAYLLADLADRLQTADPVFHLAQGFSDTSVDHDVGGRRFVIRTGGSQFTNPRRYGASTFMDYARYRLSVFTREEAGAIVAYLEHVRERPTRETDRAAIAAALDAFWRDRARSAPRAADLAGYLARQAAWLEAVARERGTAG